MEKLETYRDRNRILLIFASSPQNATYQEQKRLLEASAEGLRERDVVVLELLKDEAEMPKEFEVSSDMFTVVLIGKDGVKKRGSSSR